MKQFIQFILLLFFSTLYRENLAFPRKEEGQTYVEMSRQPFRVYLPQKQTLDIKTKALELDEPSEGGAGGFLSNIAQDGLALSSVFKSPTVFIGGFNMMMQPMPNGTELAGQIMQMVPHYTNFLPQFPGAGRQDAQEEADTNEKYI